MFILQTYLLSKYEGLTAQLEICVKFERVMVFKLETVKLRIDFHFSVTIEPEFFIKHKESNYWFELVKQFENIFDCYHWNESKVVTKGVLHWIHDYLSLF